MSKFYKVYINPDLGYYSDKNKLTYEIESFYSNILDNLLSNYKQNSKKACQVFKKLHEIEPDKTYQFSNKDILEIPKSYQPSDKDILEIAKSLWKEEQIQNHMYIGSRCLICEAANII